MILITGGAFQGKTAYAQAHFHCQITDGADCGFEDAKSAKMLKNYHILVRRLSEAGENPEAFTRTFCTDNPDCIVLMNEIGSGIIPLDKTERIWRESTGRCGCILAEKANHVIRMVCGIPNAIKGELL